MTLKKCCQPSACGLGWKLRLDVQIPIGRPPRLTLGAAFALGGRWEAGNSASSPVQAAASLAAGNSASSPCGSCCQFGSGQLCKLPCVRGGRREACAQWALAPQGQSDPKDINRNEQSNRQGALRRLRLRSCREATEGLYLCYKPSGLDTDGGSLRAAEVLGFSAY